MNRLFAKIKEEFETLLPPIIFFFITLHLVALIRVLMLKGTGVTLGTSLSVTMAALILGRAVGLWENLTPTAGTIHVKELVEIIN